MWLYESKNGDTRSPLTKSRSWYGDIAKEKQVTQSFASSLVSKPDCTFTIIYL